MTDSDTSRARKRTYNKISDVQRSKLQQYYIDGMTTCGAHNSEKIEKAADETGLTIDQVKKWIGNARQKEKIATGSQPPPKKAIKIPTGSRGSHSYNVFCAEYFKSDECKEMSLSEKNKEASKKWQDMTYSEKDQYKRNAESLKSPDVSNLSEAQKLKLISVHRKNLLKEIMFLEDMGCESSLIFKDTSGQVYNFGSSAGYSFLCLNPEINIKFRDYFACNDERYTYKDVQQLFNTKYSEAIQKPGSRVPYLHGGFTVQNLPCGLHFKRPFHYGAKQLKAIMENKDEIKFIINSSESNKKNESSRMNANVTSTHFSVTSEVVTLLSKVVGKESAARVVNMSEKVTEEEVEVMNLSLDQEERLLLNECSPFFDDDAWHAVGSNLQHSSETQGLIVPVCPESDDEKFWLFYTVQNPSKLVKASTSYRLKGYWLDVQQQSEYRLLYDHQDSVIIANLIKNGPYGPLYFLHKMDISVNQYFNISESFNNAILAALRKNNLL